MSGVASGRWLSNSRRKGRQCRLPCAVAVSHHAVGHTARGQQIDQAVFSWRTFPINWRTFFFRFWVGHCDRFHFSASWHNNSRINWLADSKTGITSQSGKREKSGWCWQIQDLVCWCCQGCSDVWQRSDKPKHSKSIYGSQKDVQQLNFMNVRLMAL